MCRHRSGEREREMGGWLHGCRMWGRGASFVLPWDGRNGAEAGAPIADPLAAARLAGWQEQVAFCGPWRSDD